MANLSDISCAKNGVLLSTSATAFEPSRAFFVDVTGSATLQFNDGGTVSFTALPVGEYHWSIKKFSAGTATIVALY